MKPIIALIGTIMVHKGKKALRDIGRFGRDLKKANEETRALWRKYKLMKGSSPNQVKPVRVLDGPMKQKSS